MALVLAIIPLGITTLAAIVIAANVLVEIPQRKARGKGLAIGALVISWVWTTLLVAIVMTAVIEEPFQARFRGTGSAVAGHSTVKISVFDLKVGHCLVTVPAEPSVTVTIASCSVLHRGEVFATFDVPQLRTQAEIDRRADHGCSTRFAAYVGRAYSKSKFDIMYMPPSASSIKIDHEVICIVTDGAKRTAGTLKNAKR